MLSLYREVLVPRLRYFKVPLLILAVAAAAYAGARHAPQAAPPQTLIAPPVVVTAPTGSDCRAEVIEPVAPVEAASVPTRVAEVPFKADDLDPAMKYRGKLVRGVRWADAAGDNFAVFSNLRINNMYEGFEAESSYLYLYHYVREQDGNVRLVRLVKERDENCTDDLVSNFHRAYEVTDLDSDGTGELLFGYFHGACITDVSPADFKLFMLEAGEKYVLRGQGYIGGMDSESMPKSSQLRGAPAVFQSRMRARWAWLADATTSNRPL